MLNLDYHLSVTPIDLWNKSIDESFFEIFTKTQVNLD